MQQVAREGRKVVREGRKVARDNRSRVASEKEKSVVLIKALIRNARVQSSMPIIAYTLRKQNRCKFYISK